MRSSLWLLAAIVAATAAHAQISGLAATDEGSQVYISTRVRINTEAALKLPTTTAIYRIVQGRLERVTYPPVENRLFPAGQGRFILNACSPRNAPPLSSLRLWRHEIVARSKEITIE